MNGNYFLDTNIFIYSFDSENVDKWKRANEIIENAFENHAGCISYQVVQEFLSAITRKFAATLSVPDSAEYLHEILYPLCKIFPSKNLFLQGLEIMQRWNFSYYDSLIIAASLEANCSILYTEDLQHNQKIKDLTIINPFK